MGCRLLLLLLPVMAWSSTGGPDGGDYVFVDSDEVDGPPHAMLDISSGAALGLGTDALEQITLPFSFHWYGDDFESAWISSNGAVFFENQSATATGACPDTGDTWSGVAGFWDDLGGGDVTWATLGQYPHRVLAVDWTDTTHASWGGAASFQVWLLEHSSEVVIQLDDVTFGYPAVDGGASAVVGIQAAAGDGLAWSCSGGLSDGSASWFSPSQSRTASALAWADAQDISWQGSTASGYTGFALASGDVNGDGLADLLVGEEYNDAGLAWLIYGGSAGGSIDTAQATFSGHSAGDLAGSALAVGDLDGDGIDDAVIGAPGSDLAGASAGVVYVFYGPSISGELDLAYDADLLLMGPSGSGRAGAGGALAIPGDVDGDGYQDLMVGGEGEDTIDTNAGAVWLWSGGGDTGTELITSATATFWGSSLGDHLGAALAGGDLSGDGLADMLLAAPDAGLSAPGAGAIYLVQGGTWSGGAEAGAVASVIFTGEQAYDAAGSSMAVGDVDGDGFMDLLAGAPNSDLGASNAGAAYLVLDPAAWSGQVCLSMADTLVEGSYAGGRLGRAVAIGDLTGSGQAELLVSAPNVTALGVSGAGMIHAFTAPATGSVAATDADYTLYGTSAAGMAGTSLAFLSDWDGDGYGDVAVGAPYASAGGISNNGEVVVWRWFPSFADTDGDGFVSVLAHGVDCDDDDPLIYPGAVEVVGNLVDDDCDGWVDDLVKVREVEDWWDWDLSQDWGDPPVHWFNFRGASAGTSLASHLSTDGVTFTTTGSLIAATSVHGSPASDTMAASLTASYSLTIEFDDSIDALGLRVLDASLPFTLSASGDSGTLVSGLPFEAPGEDLPGGTFVGFQFASSVTSVTIESTSGDGWGLDELGLAWGYQTDADGDGFTPEDGDCDDTDPDVYPGAEEDLTNGIDDDCDGIVDGGDVTLYDDDTDWSTDAAISSQIIDFEDQFPGTLSSSAYLSQGVTFTASPTVVTSVDGAAPRDTQAAQAAVGATAPDSVTMEFTDEQSAVGVWLLDLESTLSYDAWVGGVLIQSGTVERRGDDVSGGRFLGLLFDVPIDTLALTAGDDGDIFGIDDLTFSDFDGSSGSGGTEGDEEELDDGDAEHDTGDPGEGEDGDGVDDGEGGGSSSGDGDGDGDDSDGDEDEDDIERDADGDGYDAVEHGGTDCDDDDPAIHPGATEIWYDGVDQDCDGWSDYDADLDGYDCEIHSATGTDCDDTDPTVHPGATDHPYDGIDQNCDGADDYDADGDGFTVSFYGGADCDDTDATVYPGATEIWYDGVDQDCDGWSDYDADMDGYDCAIHSPTGTDCDDTDPTVHPGAVDPCGDGIDQNCDGDDTCWDVDGDGWVAAHLGGDDCDDDDPTIHPGATEIWYDGVDQDCDGWSDFDADMDGHDRDLYGGDDCDDEDPTVHPGATETWYDGVDQDCDGADDYDADGDGYRVLAWGDDCDDTNPNIHPGIEFDDCGNGDENCNGIVDEDCVMDTGEQGDSGEPDDCDPGDCEPGDTGEPGDHPRSWGETRPPVFGPEGCGCRGAPATGYAPWLLLLPVAMLARRREGARAQG